MLACCTTYFRPITHKAGGFSTIGPIFSNFIAAKTGTPSNTSNINVLLKQSNLEPLECIKILDEVYKNSCKLELCVLQRAEFYNICKDIITGGLQNPLPLKTFISDPINTYFDVKFSYNRINTLLANQIDTTSSILLKHGTRKDSNIYLFPKDGIETVGSLNNPIRFDNPFNDSHNDEQKYNLNLDSLLKSIFNKSDAHELVTLLKYLYLMDTPMNLNILTNVCEKFVSNMGKLSLTQISETSYILSSYFNDINIPNVINSLAYHSQYFICNSLHNYPQSFIPSLYLLCHCKGEQIFFKSIINKLVSQNYTPDNITNYIRLQIILSLVDMGNDSLSKNLSQEINNQIFNHFNNIAEPGIYFSHTELIHVAKMIFHRFSKPICDKLLDFVYDNLSDLHLDSVSSIYLYLSAIKSLTNEHNNMMNKLLLYINNHLGSVSGGLIPDIYTHTIRQSKISDDVMKLFEKNLLLNKRYLTSKDISNMILSLTVHGKNQNSVIKILLEQFLHLKRHDRSKAEDTLDTILAFSLAGVRHSEMWDNVNLPIMLSNVTNTLLVYIGYAFLITEYRCNVCWSIIVERLLYENVQHSADIFKVLKIAKLMNYISLINDGTTMPTGSAVILDRAAIQKFNSTITECKHINLNKLSSSKLSTGDLQKYSEIISQIGIPFECNFVIDDLYLVAFYLPSHKIIIDIIQEKDIKARFNFI